MYLRKSKKPNGRTYLTIVQGYRDEDGKNRARTVKSLGYVDALEAELDDPVAHFGEECRRMTAEAARPVYCSTESHIRAHFLVCYVALLAMRLMQLDTGRKYSAAQISEALAGVTGHLVDRNLYLFDYRTDLTDELAGAVGINLSRQVLTRGQIRSIMADVGKPRS